MRQTVRVGNFCNLLNYIFVLDLTMMEDNLIWILGVFIVTNTLGQR